MKAPREREGLGFGKGGYWCMHPDYEEKLTCQAYVKRKKKGIPVFPSAGLMSRFNPFLIFNPFLPLIGVPRPLRPIIISLQTLKIMIVRLSYDSQLPVTPLPCHRSYLVFLRLPPILFLPVQTDYLT